MSGQAVYETVTSVEIDNDGHKMPCAHMAFPIGNAPALPWCVYYLDEMSGFAGDNRLIAKNNNWVVEHYWRTYDAGIEERLEDAIESTFGAFKKTEVWVEDENCVQSTYYFAEIEKCSRSHSESE